MAETPVQPTPIAGEVTITPFDPLRVNDSRISADIDRLSVYTLETAKDNTMQLHDICISLARSIDFSIANHEFPSRVQELPSLLNQVCRINNNARVQSAVMVLMVSVQNAGQCEWFTSKDCGELIDIWRRMSNSCPLSKFDIETTSSFSIISTVMSRFYPRMEMGHMLVYLDVKPGFDAYASGFLISKNLSPSPGLKIRLLVVQTDDITTSSCLSGPSKVSFLLNGQGVQRRITVSMDKGPQIPTDVTDMLKFGSNLLQAVGDFEGNCTIALAFMSHVQRLDSSSLQDYVQEALTPLDSDVELIQESLRVSLNCPISLKRINTPVKGHCCRHIQCFDFHNYLNINSRRPYWRCPHCYQHVCFTEIRIDRKMVKILEEVAINVTKLAFGLDGSWSAVLENDENMQEPVDNISNGEQEEPSQTDVVDLTLRDDTIDSVVPLKETEELKTFPASSQSQLTGKNNSQIPPDANQSCAPVEHGFWSSVFLSTFSVLSTDEDTASNNNRLPAVSTNQVAHSNQVTESLHGDTNMTQTAPSIPPLPLYQSAINEHGRLQSASRHITRTPIGVQALPAQTSTSLLRKRTRDDANTLSRDSRLTATQSMPHMPVISNINNRNSLNIIQQPSSQLLQHTGLQRNNSVPPSQSTLPRNSIPPHMVNSIMPSRDETNLPCGSGNQQQFLLHNKAISSTGHLRSSTEITFSSTSGVESAEQNWRPTSRMRGALTGQAYVEAMNQYIIQPAQQARPQNH